MNFFRSTLTRKNLAISIIGTLFWVIFLSWFGSKHHTFKANWQDNVSNISAVQLLILEGVDIFKEPVQSFVHPLSESEVPSRFLTDVDSVNWFWHESLGKDRPLFFVWPDVPRPYPIGAWLYYAPSSLLVYQFGLSMSFATLLNTFLFLLIAHLCFFLIKNLVYEELKDSIRQSQFWRWCFGFFALTMYFEFIHWSGQGQYDLISMLPLIIFFKNLKSLKWKESLVFYGLALNLHFRSLFSLGSCLSVIFCSFLTGRADQKLWNVRNLKWYAVALGLALTSGFIFILNSRFLTDTSLYQHNEFHYQSLIQFQNFSTFSFLCIAMVLAGWILWQRFWQLFFWFSLAFFIFVSTPQLRSWYVMFLFPAFLLIGCSSRPKRTQQFALVSAVYVYFASFIFKQSPFEFYFLRDLYEIFQHKL